MEQERWESRYLSGDAPWDSGIVSVELQRILSSHPIPAGRALELGCGTGVNAVWLAQQGFSVTAVDISPTAMQRAQERARQAGVAVDFRALDLLSERLDLPPFDLVFDRGVYHVLRRENLGTWLAHLETATRPGSHYITLAGNANDPASDETPGPPRVHAHELCAELHPLFDLVELREYRWSPVMHGDLVTNPLGWAALLRRVARCIAP